MAVEPAAARRRGPASTASGERCAAACRGGCARRAAVPELAAADLADQGVGDAELLGERHRGLRRFADVADLLPVEAAVALLRARAGLEEGADLDRMQERRRGLRALRYSTPGRVMTCPSRRAASSTRTSVLRPLLIELRSSPRLTRW